MRKVLVLIVALLSLGFNEAKGQEKDPFSSKTVLILFSFSPTTPAYRFFLEGIRNELTKAFGDSYNIHTEYLESERYPKDGYPEAKFELYNKKYSEVKIDLLICIGVDIVRLIKRYAEPYLLSLPTITIDLELSRYGIPFDMTLNDKTTVVPMVVDAGLTITEALNVFPKTSSIYFISGTSRIDKIYEQIARGEEHNIDNRIKRIFITDRTMDEILVTVHNLPPNSLILIPGFNNDADNVPYYNPEATRLISKAANAPVFTLSDMGFGDGSFGGKFLNFKKIGTIGGKTAVRILNGTDPATIKIQGDEGYTYMFDWREAVRFNRQGFVRKASGASIMYRDESFLGKYKWFLIAGIVFLFLQTSMIAQLIRMNRKQKQMTTEIVETDRRYMEIIVEDRILRMGMLSASLSHELNQPLTAILSTAQAGKRFMAADNTDPELLNEIFDNIIEDNNRAASTLRSIRGLMKLEKRERERVNLNSLISDVTNLYRSKAIELNSKINLFLPDKPAYVMVDSIQIQQVLLNFITNASQSIDSNREHTKIIDIFENIENEFVSVSVRDYGKGIDTSMLNKLFQPFVTSKPQGEGIGLSISKLIIEDHDGKIWARNMQDGGAEFSFKLKMSES